MQLTSGLPSDRALRQAFPELWGWYDAHGYPDAERPVRSTLVLAVIRRFSFLTKIASKGWLGKPPDPDDPSDDLYLRFCLIMERLQSLGLGDKASQLARELKELLKWLAPASTRRQRQDALMAAFEASDPKARKEIFEFVLRHFREDRRGHPLTAMRLLWVKALEEKLRSPELSWMRINIKLCSSGETTPTQKSKNNMRQGVRKLERMLKNYHINLCCSASARAPLANPEN
jgi:hypothetical protein